MVKYWYKFINKRISIYFKINCCVISLLVGIICLSYFFLMNLRLNGWNFFINNLDMLLWSILFLR